MFIHPSSVLANASPPDYVIFHEVVRTSRIWLKGIISLLVFPSCETQSFIRSHGYQPGMVINSWKAIALYLFKTCENNGWYDDGNTKVRGRGLGTTCGQSTGITVSNIKFLM